MEEQIVIDCGIKWKCKGLFQATGIERA